MYENLHCHTKTSDGELDYKQVLNVCEKNNISIVAFCDHDHLIKEKEFKELKNLNHKTKWISGIELSSGWPKEIGGPASSFHIAGFFVDPLNKDLLNHCEKFQQGRFQRMKMIIKNLNSLGFSISKEGCLKQSQGESVGRKHIADTLVSKQKNLKIIENLRLKMEKESQNNEGIRKQYQNMMDRGKHQYPYVLFLSKDSFIPNIYVDYPYYKNLDQTVELIRNAGGIAILAHWTFAKHKIDEKIVEKLFQEKRLDGAEIVFGLGVTGHNIDQDMKTMKNLTEKYNLIQSGGGDSHEKQDFKYFAQHQAAKQTIGMIEKMKKIKDLNIEFSSI